MFKKILRHLKIQTALDESEKICFLISSTLKQNQATKNAADLKTQTNKLAKRFQAEIFKLQQTHRFGWLGKAVFAHGVRMNMLERGFTEETAEQIAKECAIMISLVKIPA